MKRSAFVFVTLAALAGCGREGALVSGIELSSPSPDATSTPTVETPEPSETPEATQATSPSPTSPVPSATASVGTSGILGSVKAGPTCPVEQANSPCPDRPVAGAEVTAKTASGETAGTARTDDQGAFRMPLKPGSYEVTASSDSVMGCDTQGVDVAANHYTPVRITCDTGIR